MKRDASIRKQLSDMIALNRHILEAVERQRGDGNVREHPEVNELVIRIERTLTAHVAELEELAGSYGSGTGSILKKAVTQTLGMAAGLYDKIREHERARMLRDNYTALNHVAISYAMLHTFGLAVSEENVADIAKRHLGTIPPLLESIRQSIPHVVAAEIGEQDEFSVVSGVGPRAVKNLENVWMDAAVDRATI